MKAAAFSIRHSFLLFQLGALLFLFALLVGFLVSKFPVPRLGLSAHLLGVMQALFLILLGVLWPKLDLSQAASRLGVALALYGCFAAWLANVLAAVWGAGNSMLPLAAGAAHGSTLQELTIDGVATTADLHRRLINEPELARGDYHTSWLEGYLAR